MKEGVSERKEEEVEFCFLLSFFEKTDGGSIAGSRALSAEPSPLLIKIRIAARRRDQHGLTRS